MISILKLALTLNIITATTSCNQNRSDETKQQVNEDVPQKCHIITKKSFLVLAKKMINDMGSSSVLNVEQAKIMVKVYNTMHLASIANDEQSAKFSEEFRNAFREQLLNKIMQILECGYGKRMTIYSKKHDLYVGSGTVARCNDVYTLL